MKLATFSPISNGALKSETLPTRIHVLSFGKSITLDNPIFVNEKTKKVFSAIQKQIGRERVPIDYSHNTVQGSKAYEDDKEPRAIAGYGTPVIQDDGLWLEDIKWTPNGKDNALNYEDLSPAPLLDEENVVIGLHSVALTPAGAVENLTFYSADTLFNDMNIVKKLFSPASTKTEGVVDATIKPAAADDMTKDHPDDCMCAECMAADDKISKDNNIKPMSAVVPNVNAFAPEPAEMKTFPQFMNDNIKKLAADQGMPEGDLASKLKALLAEWLGTQSNEGPITNKSNSTPAQFSAPQDDQVKELNTRLKVLETDRAEAIARYEASEKDNIIKEATRNGKVIPFGADEIKDISPKLLKVIVDKLPKEQVPTKVTMRVLNVDGKETKKSTMDDARSAWQEAVDAVMAKA